MLCREDGGSPDTPCSSERGPGRNLWHCVSRSWTLSLGLSDSHFPPLGRIRAISKPKSGHDLLAPSFHVCGSSDCLCCHCRHSLWNVAPLLRSLQETPGISGGAAVSSSASPLPCGLLVCQVAGPYRASPLRLQRGCTVMPVASLCSHGGTLKSFSESPLEGLTWVSHHVTAWLDLRSHMRKEPSLGTGSRLGRAQPWPTSWPWAGGTPHVAAASQP